MEEKKLIAYLKQVHPEPPDATWLKDARQSLVAHMKTANAPIHTEGVFMTFAHALIGMRIAFGSAVAAALIMAGLTTMLESQQPLPTSRLYPLKLVMEAARGTFAFTAEQQALYELGVARARVDELQRMSNKTQAAPNIGKETTDSAMAGTARRYARAIETSAKAVRQLRDEGNVPVAKAAVEQLNDTAYAYTVMLAAFESATSLPILTDAEITVREALETARDVLSSLTIEEDIGAAGNNDERAIGITAVETASSAQGVAADSEGNMSGNNDGAIEINSTVPAIPSIIPNIVE